jgi:hypothetical protein
MGVILTYHWHSGFLHSVTSGKNRYLPTSQEPGRLAMWNRMWKSRDRHILHWDHLFEIPQAHAGTGAAIYGLMPTETNPLGFNQKSGSSRAIYDYPGEMAQRFEDADPRAQGIHHPHREAVICIGDRHSGLYIHSWALCDQPQCIVVMQGWEEVFAAIREQPELTFSIVR